MVVAGVLAPDPVRGNPPGAPIDPSAKPTWVALIHHVVRGPVSFIAIFGACLAVASGLDGGWRRHTFVTAGVGLVMTFSTAVMFQKDAPKTGFVQRGLPVSYWS